MYRDWWILMVRAFLLARGFELGLKARNRVLQGPSAVIGGANAADVAEPAAAVADDLNAGGAIAVEHVHGLELALDAALDAGGTDLVLGKHAPVCSRSDIVRSGEVVAGFGEAVEGAAGRYRPRHVEVSAAGGGEQ